MVTNQGFSCKIGTWGYDRNKRAYTVQNKIDSFAEELSLRLKYTQIESNQAHKVIESRDTKETFAYVDPPYIDTNQGHYGGYTHEHFKRDLNTLAAMQGKFLLSTYPSDILSEYTNMHGRITSYNVCYTKLLRFSADSNNVVIDPSCIKRIPLNNYNIADINRVNIVTTPLKYRPVRNNFV